MPSLLTASLELLIADEAAIKAVYENKGSSGLFPCMMCSNVVNRSSSLSAIDNSFLITQSVHFNMLFHIQWSVWGRSWIIFKPRSWYSIRSSLESWKETWGSTGFPVVCWLSGPSSTWHSLIGVIATSYRGCLAWRHSARWKVAFIIMWCHAGSWFPGNSLKATNLREVWGIYYGICETGQKCLQSDYGWHTLCILRRSRLKNLGLSALCENLFQAFEDLFNGQRFPSRSIGMVLPYLEDHPMTFKWLITMVSCKSPKDRVSLVRNGRSNPLLTNHEVGAHPPSKNPINKLKQIVHPPVLTLTQLHPATIGCWSPCVFLLVDSTWYPKKSNLTKQRRVIITDQFQTNWDFEWLKTHVYFMLQYRCRKQTYP